MSSMFIRFGGGLLLGILLSGLVPYLGFWPTIIIALLVGAGWSRLVTYLTDSGE